MSFFPEKGKVVFPIGIHILTIPVFFSFYFGTFLTSCTIESGGQARSPRVFFFIFHPFFFSSAVCNPKHDSHITFHSAQAGGSFSLFLSHQHHLCNPPSSFKIPDRDAGITDQNRENPRSYRVRPSVPFLILSFLSFLDLLSCWWWWRALTHTGRITCAS